MTARVGKVVESYTICHKDCHLCHKSLSQSVDDMSQNKIVTNRPSTKINCDTSSIHFGTFRSFLCDISSRTNSTYVTTLVTYVPAVDYNSNREGYALLKQT